MARIKGLGAARAKYLSVSTRCVIEKDRQVMGERKDPYNLERFIEAQVGRYEIALSEIANGRKRSHWMWFIFPQMLGLGSGSNSVFYGIRNAEEAKRYLDHPILGRRLMECTVSLLVLTRKTSSEIFDSPDDMKLRSSMTLFEHVAGEGSVFEKVLKKYFGGIRDEKTLLILKAGISEK